MSATDQLAKERSEGGDRMFPREAGGGRHHSDELLRLERENAELRRRNAELEGFTAMAAHEVLKPLVLAEARVTGVLERSSGRLDLSSQEDLRAMLRASARARIEVEVLLSEALHGRRKLGRDYVDMAKVVRDTLDLLRPEIDARRARVVVGPLPVVIGNGPLLSGAMNNLVANAIKYGARSDGEIRIGCERERDDWVFEVDSPGRPIPERDRSRIFAPWERGRGERRIGGAGLGLAIVRRIVERHGGRVGVEALGRRGNRFYFTIPTA